MTLFEKIIAREIPAQIIYEDEACIAIKDINPQAPHHVLIVPRRVIPRVGDATPEDQATLGALLLAAGKVARQLGVSEAGKGFPAGDQSWPRRGRDRAPHACASSGGPRFGMAAGLNGFERHEMSEARKIWLWSAALALGCSLAVAALFSAIHYHWRWDAIWERREMILWGWGVTAMVSLAALLLCIVIALLLMAGQRARILPLRLFSRGVVEFVRGTPLLVQILVGYYIVGNALRLNARTPVGIVILALFEGAYLAEIFRGALESIGASQLEAAQAVGFDRRQTWRFVILPQAMRRALPGHRGTTGLAGEGFLAAVGHRRGRADAYGAGGQRRGLHRAWKALFR